MAKDSGKITGRDAAYIKPKFVPDDELLGRDDSGGPDYDPYTQQFGDGGFVQGEKAHLSAKGGREDEEEGDEIGQGERDAGYEKREGSKKANRSDVPSRSRKEGRE